MPPKKKSTRKTVGKGQTKRKRSETQQAKKTSARKKTSVAKSASTKNKPKQPAGTARAKTAQKKSPTKRKSPAARDKAVECHGAEVSATSLPPRTAFPVVGLGASAGGLEALQAFFKHLPADTGCAYVVVTHMHREHTSMLPELLGKETALPVVEAADGCPVEPDHVYVAPPRDNLTIEDGVLRLGPADDETRLPVDHFLRSLAADQRDHAIAIILSGTGTDGTLGVQTVKAEAGMAMVQQAQTARFAGMPASAEATGLVDFVLPPGKMPSELVAYVDELHTRARVPTRAEPEFPQDALQQILGTLRMRTGNDFGAYKRSTIRRRIERRMNIHRIQSPYEYGRYLKDHRHETNLLFRELLITVTGFFRDPGAFDAVAETVADQLRTKDEGHGFRVWIPGCATGEEAYSVAIVLHECLMKLERSLDVQVFATDLDPHAIEHARAGVYPGGIAADVSARRLKRHFTHDHGMYRINKDIREMVIFAPQNVLSDPPFTRQDLIVCRNLLIYFESRLQRKLLPTFHYALRPGGVLFLGPSETVGPLDDLFEPIDRKWKVFRRKDSTPTTHPLALEPAAPHSEAFGRGAAPTEAPPAEQPTASDGCIQRLLLSRFAPTCLVVEESGDIVYIHGRTGLYLEPSEGEPQHNAVTMAREGLATPLMAALRRAANRGAEVVRRGISVKTNSEYTKTDLTVLPIKEPEALRGLFVVTLRPTSDALPKRRAKRGKVRDDVGRVTELEDELRHSQESLRSTVEELESSNEELKSANEELQSMNEELQSANEELETSKEEMQSLNEELTTVNNELNSKIDDLSHANDDMQNLLNGIDVATVFLDENLRIKRYTERARELVHLVPTDVGRPLADLALHVEHPRLIEECRRVLKTLERHEEEVRSANGNWLMMRILPYRTSKNIIDGVVLTFVAIDRLKRAERGADEAHAAREYFESIVQTVRAPLLVLEGDLTVRSGNEAFYRTFQVTRDEAEGRGIYDLGNGQWDLPRLRELLEDILSHDSAFDDFVVEHEFPEIGTRRFVLNARRLEQGNNIPELILLALEDVTERGE